jgi:Flp pilus assembly protein TadG
VTGPRSRRGGARNRPPTPPTAGQAAVEFTLILPLLLVLLLALVQVGLVVRDQILVVHAAREAARQMAVDPSAEAARQAAEAASTLDPSRLEISVGDRGKAGSRVRVTARYRAPTGVPVVGEAVGDLQLTATATMRVER